MSNGHSDPRELLTPAFLVPATVIVLVVLAYYGLTWPSFDAFANAIDHCPEPLCDFSRHYYPMGRDILVTGEPVPGFYYSPFFALLLAVFRPLAFDSALVLWGGLQTVLIASLVFLPLLFTVRSVHYLLLHLFLVLTAFPVLHNFKWGQVSVLLLVVLFVGLFLYQRGHLVAAALLFALAISLKFYPAVFLVLFLFRKDLHFVLLAGGAALLLLMVVPFLALGVDETIRFYRILQASLGAADPLIASNPNSQYFPHVVTRLADYLTYDGGQLEPLVKVLGYAVAAVNLLFLYWILRLDRPLSLVWGTVVLLLTLPFVVPTAWPHYFVYLPFCQFLLWQEAMAGDDPLRRRLLVIVLLVVPSIICSNVVLFNLTGGGLVYSYLGFLLLADALLVVACYVVLAPPILKAMREPA